jgi:hypothetical protein
MKGSASKLKREVNVQKNRQTDDQIINNLTKNQLIKNGKQDKITLTDITKEQWFWDKAVLS